MAELYNGKVLSLEIKSAAEIPRCKLLFLVSRSNHAPIFTYTHTHTHTHTHTSCTHCLMIEVGAPATKRPAVWSSHRTAAKYDYKHPVDL